MADKKERCNVRFCSHNGLKSDVAACPKGADAVEKGASLGGFSMGSRFPLVFGWASEPIGERTADLRGLLRNRRTHSTCWRAE